MPWLAAAAPIIGSMIGAGGGIASAAMSGGGPQGGAGQHPVDPGSFQYGGYTGEQGAANSAQSDSDAMGAINQLMDFAGRYGGDSTNPAGGNVGNSNFHHIYNDQQLNDYKRRAAEAQMKANQAGTYAQREALRNEARGDVAAQRQGPQMDTRNIDADRALGQQARGRVTGALDMYQQAAEGKGPSAAQGMLQQGLDRNIAMQRSLAASAKSPAMQRAELQSQSLANAGQLGAQNSAQAAILRAQEQQAGMAGLMQGSLGLRSGDAQSQGLSLSQSNAQTGYDANQRGLNDAMQRYYEGNRQSVQDQQFAASQRQAGANQQGAMAADATNAQYAAARAKARADAAGGILGGAVGGAQAGSAIAGGFNGGNQPAAGATPAAPSPKPFTGNNGGGSVSEPGRKYDF